MGLRDKYIMGDVGAQVEQHKQNTELGITSNKNPYYGMSSATAMDIIISYDI